MRIVYFGSSSFGIPCLEAIAASGHELAAVFTQPARPAGRHRQLKATDVAIWCREHNIPCIESDNINEPSAVQQVKAYGGDLLVVIAFGQKISQPLVQSFSHGAINVHGSLLPRYRGAAPIHWAIINGESRTGVSVITLADRMDAGLILGQAQTAIEPEDNFQTVHDRLSQLSAPLLIETIGQIDCDAAHYLPQDESLVTKAPKLKKEHGFIDWSRPAAAIANQIRGLWPWPGTQAVYVSAKTGKSWQVSIADAYAVELDKHQPAMHGILDDQLRIICGQGKLEIKSIKPAGSGRMDFAAFINGRQGCPGDLFLSIDMVRRQFA